MTTSTQELSSVLAGLRILVVDDEPELLVMLDDWFTSFGVKIHTARDGCEAISQAMFETFDIVVTDLNMPGMDGLQLLSSFKELDPEVEVIILAGTGTMDDAIAALRQGRAFDYLKKPLKSLTQLNESLAGAANRRRQSIEKVIPQAYKITPPAIGELSTQESEILALLSQGLINKEIADRLGKSEKTIKNNLTRIYDKLQVKTRAQAILLLQRNHLT